MAQAFARARPGIAHTTSTSTPPLPPPPPPPSPNSHLQYIRSTLIFFFSKSCLDADDKGVAWRALPNARRALEHRHPSRVQAAGCRRERQHPYKHTNWHHHRYSLYGALLRCLPTRYPRRITLPRTLFTPPAARYNFLLISIILRCHVFCRCVNSSTKDSPITPSSSWGRRASPSL